MLVLSRQRGEKLVICQDIVVTVLEVRGNRVNLGIQAPSSVPVNRIEVFHRLGEDVAEGQGDAVS